MLPLQDLSGRRVSLFKLSAMLQSKFGSGGFEIYLMNDTISVKAPDLLSTVCHSSSGLACRNSTLTARSRNSHSVVDAAANTLFSNGSLSFISSRG